MQNLRLVCRHGSSVWLESATIWPYLPRGLRMRYTCDGFGAGEGAQGIRDGVDILRVDVQVHQEAGLQGGARGRALCPDLAAQRSSKQFAGGCNASLLGKPSAFRKLLSGPYWRPTKQSSEF